MRARQGGGFNQLGGGLGSEHLDENATSSMQQQHQLTQQQADPQQVQQQVQNQKAQDELKHPPREVGSLVQEGKRAVGDIFRELKQFLSLSTWLGLEFETMTPDEKAKARTVHQNFNRLTQEQQQEAKKRFQLLEQKKKQQEEERIQKEQAKKQQEAQSIQMPTSTKKGPIGPASGKSKKQNAQAKLQQDRQRMSQGGGSN